MNDFNLENTGAFIKFLRKEKNLTMEQVAKYLGVSKPAVSQWEKGEGIKIENLYVLSRLFGVSVDELFNAKRNDESNFEVFKRNFDLSLYDFDEDNFSNRLAKEYYSRLKLIKERFFELINIWVNGELNDNLKEELNFLKQYFDIDNRYLSYLKNNKYIYIDYFDEKDVIEVIKNKLDDCLENSEENLNWELEKIFSIKKEWMKTDIICNSNNCDLLEKLLMVMNKPQKDTLLALTIKNESDRIKNDISYDYKSITKRNRTLDELIEQSPYLKIMFNNGCNIMKQSRHDSYLDEEDMDYLEGELIFEKETISLDSKENPYLVYSDEYLVNSLLHWKEYTYEKYESFVDGRRTEFYKALVNFKEDEPLKYYEALKKYYEGY